MATKYEAAIRALRDVNVSGIIVYKGGNMEGTRAELAPYVDAGLAEWFTVENPPENDAQEATTDAQKGNTRAKAKTATNAK